MKALRVLTLAGILMLGVVLLYDAYLVWRKVQLHRETDGHSKRLQQIDAKTREWQMLFQNLVAYSVRQPEIDPILQKYGLKESSVASKPR